MPLWRLVLAAINLVGVRFGGAAIGLLSQVLLARMLHPSEVGVVLMAMSATAIVSLIATGGYASLAITCLPRYYALGRMNLVRAYHQAFWRETFLISGLIFALAAVAILFMPLETGTKQVILFACLSAPAAVFIRINGTAANSVRRFSLSYVPDFIFRPGFLLTFLAVAWLGGFAPGVSAILWAFVAGNSLVAAGQAWILGRNGSIPRLSSRWRDLRPMLRGRAASLIIVAIVAASFADLVTLAGGFFLPPDEVAVLGISIRLAALAGFVSQATQQFILPDLTVAMARGTAAEVRQLLLRINLVALSAIGGCVVLAAVAGDYLLAIFGRDYAAGKWALVLFMISQTFRAASGMNQHLLSLAGHQATTALACVVAVVVLISAAALLTPRFGVDGMAVAVVAADLMWACLLAIQAQRLTGRRGDILGLIRPAR